MVQICPKVFLIKKRKTSYYFQPYSLTSLNDDAVMRTGRENERGRQEGCWGIFHCWTCTKSVMQGYSLNYNSPPKIFVAPIAPPKLPLAERRQGDNFKTHKSELLDDIQVLNLSRFLIKMPHCSAAHKKIYFYSSTFDANTKNVKVILWKQWTNWPWLTVSAAASDVKPNLCLSLTSNSSQKLRLEINLAKTETHNLQLKQHKWVRLLQQLIWVCAASSVSLGNNVTGWPPTQHARLGSTFSDVKYCSFH